MRWIVWIVAAIAVIALVVVVVGYSLPTAHTVTRTARLALPPEALYAVLSDVDRYPSWRPSVKSLVRAPDRDGRPAWVEDTGGMKIPMYFERMDRPSLLVARTRRTGSPPSPSATVTESGSPTSANSVIALTIEWTRRCVPSSRATRCSSGASRSRSPDTGNHG